MAPPDPLTAAIAHHKAGRLADAAAAYRQALSIQPNLPDALHLLGAALGGLGRAEEGVGFVRRAVEVEPGRAVFYDSLGKLLAGLGRREEAVAAFRRAVAVKPDFADAYGNLGNALTADNEYDERVRAYQRAAELRPGEAVFPFNLGTAYLARASAAGVGGDEARQLLEAAAACYRRALALRPDYANASNNLGSALQALGRGDEAIAAFERATAIGPHAEASYNLGRALYDAGRWDEAVAALETSLRLRPDHPAAWTNLGNLFRQQSRLDDALACYDRAATLRPNDLAAPSNRLYTLYFHPGYDDPAILCEHREWNERVVKAVAPPRGGHANDPNPGRRLRIGFVSPDFGNHVLGLHMAPLFARLDRQKLELICYSDVAIPDDLTTRLRGSVDGWRDILGQSDAAVADLIAGDGIDVLFDLTLHMARNRLPVFARQPAPVQVTWMGYPGTTGLDAMDYRLTDPYLDPPGEGDGNYAERSVRLPHTFWCWDPEAIALAAVPTPGPPPALDAGRVTFGCLNNFCKVNAGVLDLWKSVLDAVPGSRLRLLGPQGTRRRWVEDALGGRVDFVPRQKRQQYLEEYWRIDVGLDTLPYNGHTTSLDSFWMGVPVVTLVGRTLAGRAGLSQLTNLGLPDLAARTPAEFVALAAGLANDLPRLAALRAGLRGRMRASPLMDIGRFAVDFEATLRGMWRVWCEKK